MEDPFQRTVAKILKLDWDREKQAYAIAALTKDDVQKLRVLDDEAFEAALETLLYRGNIQRLDEDQVLRYLERDYGEALRERIMSSSTDLCRKEGPIIPNKNGLVHDVEGRSQLQGYEELGQRALHGLLMLQSRSNSLQPGYENQDDKFACGTQIIRMVSPAGTGKTTALRNLWGYVHDNFDDLVTSLPFEEDDSDLSQMRKRVMSCLSGDRFLSFTFSNEGLPELLPEEASRFTGEFMATRMLYAILSPTESDYRAFLRKMNFRLRLTVDMHNIMDFVHQVTGLRDQPGLIVFNYDDCDVPQLQPGSNTTYLQHGLSRLVSWRQYEALKRFAPGDQKRDILPVVVIAGSRAAHMYPLKVTGSGYPRLFDLGKPLLDDKW